MNPPELSRGRSGGLLAGLLLLTFAVAGVGGLATADGVQTWYPALDKPPWTPPNWAFGPVWTVLYTAMAVALWDVIRRAPGDWRQPAGLWGAQLALNLLWSPMFFAWHLTGLALLVMTVLWGFIAACVVHFGRVSRPAAGAMALYLAWVSIAWSLNAWVWWFNR